jgi:2-keto-4-pentenoate hydratase/2-oxohepta-3-ene-1,7-dioic acid hydratase in catechol pathway
MKIICIGRNYAEHAKEMNHDLPDKPVVFMKPDTALKRKALPFFHPDFSSEIHYETEIVLRICKHGKNIEEKFANKYFDQISVGIDFTARDLQSECKKKGLPWEISKAFDNSACVGDFIPTSKFTSLNDINFCMYLNKKLAQKGNTKDMIFSFEKIISYASKFFTLLEGDFIFTGTPVGVGAVAIGDHLECFIEDDSLLEFDVK